MPRLCFSALLCLAFISVSVRAVEPDKAPSGRVDAQKAIATFAIPPGFKVDLFAAEPELRHPVALCLDEQGRVYLAEEFRFNRGTEENRKCSFLLDDDLQCNTLADRLKMYEKHAARFPDGMKHFSKHGDQVRMVEDRDGDGTADRSTIFAGGFNDPLDGIGSGVIARDGVVYYTCIPNLWKLRDADGDGVAEERTSLARGFGVNCAYLGHDLHGLVWGPDGKLYFSVGDRGYDVTTREGKHLHDPRRGAVFRCSADGSQLEVVHRGLRNPQELAFDAYGNLFADDNNCDKGDHARLVFVIDGGDTGWNMAYQTLPEPYLVGPWHAERIWHLAPAADQPAWIVPACGKIGTGPSGFVYNGTDALGSAYRDHFFMANYTGNGGIETFRVVPKGASFEIEAYRDFLKPIRATDMDFGYDGKMYISDYGVLDWTGESNFGRVYTLYDAKHVADPKTQEIKKLFAAGFAKRSNDELFALLRHDDMRVRQRAQFALVDRGDAVRGELTKLALAAGPLLPRLHALWAVGQLAARDPQAVAALDPLLDDADGRLRSQTAKVFGDVGFAGAGPRLIAALQDTDAHVRLRAAIALGKLHEKSAIEPLIALLRTNADADPYLRHAAIHGLELLGDADRVAALANDMSPAVRLGAVVVLRRLGDRRLKKFLDDESPRVAAEAARAVNDLQWDDAMPALADRLPKWNATASFESDPILRRGIHAAFRRGTEADLAAVADVVANAAVSSAVRAEALRALGDWSDASTRDRVTGIWRPSAARDAAPVVRIIGDRFTTLLASAAGPLQADVIRLAVKLKLAVDERQFAGMVGDVKAPIESRAAALQLLAVRKSAELEAAADRALADPLPRLRTEARKVLAVTDPERALKSLVEALATDGDVPERQEALTTLASLNRAESDKLLIDWLTKLAAGQVPDVLALDVLKAAESRDAPEVKKTFKSYMKELDGENDLLRKHRFSLVGGDAERGRAAFTSHRHAQCIRCHKVQGTGGEAGPDLTKVAEKNDRTHLLQSLLDPNAKIAPGFGSVVLALADGTLLAGVLKEETKERLTVVTPDGKTVTVKAAEIEDRTPPKSPMPAMHEVLTRRELRDIVEFLSTLK
jgi:quinoprotein glucose dehydrogenase